MTRYIRAPEVIRALAAVAECDLDGCPARTCLCRQQGYELARRYTLMQGLELEPSGIRTSQTYTDEEMGKIVAMRLTGASVAEIAVELNRPARSIVRKIKAMKTKRERILGGPEMSRRQAELLVFIDGFWHQHGYGPSFQEMAHALHLASKSSIHRMIGALHDQKRISCSPSHGRSVRVLPIPNTAVAEHVNG